MKRGLISLILFLLFVFQSLIPTAGSAFETRRVVLIGPIDTAHYHSQDINKIINEHWKRVFRYPFYEVTAEICGMGKPPDKAVLEQMARENNADIALATEIVRLRDITYSRGLMDDETWQEIDLQLAVSTYVRRGGQYQRFLVKRSQSEPLSVNSGAEPLMIDAMEEALAKAPFKRIPQDR